MGSPRASPGIHAEKLKLKLTAEYQEAARRNLQAVKAEAHRLCDRGFSVPTLDGKIPRDTGWQNAPRNRHVDIELQFRPRLFDGVMSWPNLGFRIDAEAAGDAPNLVTDVDIRTDDPAEIAACMTAVRRHMGDRVPDAVTGRGGLHLYDQFPPERLARIFGTDSDGRLLKNVHKLDWLRRDDGVPYDNSSPWTIELFGPKHNVVCPPSIHPATLKPYQTVAT
jgi:hypothetical protein